MVNNIKNNTISEISAKEGLNTWNEIKNTEIIKYKRHTPQQKELLNLFSDLFHTIFIYNYNCNYILDTILIDKTLESESQEGKNENENDKNEKQNKLLNNDNNANAKNKKTSTNTKKATNKKKKMRIKTFC